MSAQSAPDPLDVLAERFVVLGRVVRELRRDGRSAWLDAQLEQVRTALGADAKVPAARQAQARLICWAFEVAALSCCELAQISPPAARNAQTPPKTPTPATLPPAPR